MAGGSRGEGGLQRQVDTNSKAWQHFHILAPEWLCQLRLQESLLTLARHHMSSLPESLARAARVFMLCPSCFAVLGHKTLALETYAKVK